MDAVRAYLNLSSTYQAKRGSFSSQGKLLPRTTVADVLAIKKLILPNCTYVGTIKAHMCEGWDSQNFRHTVEYQHAKEAWLKIKPSWNEQLSFNSEYSRNADFWNAFREYAVMRSAAGAVPSRWEYAKEATAEAAKELADKITNSLPNVSPIVNLVKWGTIAGGLYLFYSMMKPEKR